MKRLIWAALLPILLIFDLKAQNQPAFQVVLEEIALPGFPGLQAFVLGESAGKWLVIGGRKDGLHRRQPFASFDAAGMNEQVYVLDPNTQAVWSKPLAELPSSMAEQLQSTNMEFKQSGKTLYIIGGYGYSPTAGDHITYPFLTAVDVPGAIDAIINNQSIKPFFRQAQDARLKVTGGYLDQLGDYFYLAGGQDFVGRYNPMGPTHGPGFFQAYTNEIRKFKIADDGVIIALADYSAWRDTQNLHRRDYNMVPQVFPNGKRGFTMFSGVFRYDVDLPWLNTVDFDSSGYSVNNNFNQHLNQYHTAHLAVHDAAENQMHTIFFGGISRYRVDDVTGFLIDDTEVPFVKTISMVTRFADGQMKESKIGEMPQLLGASAEFIPLPDLFDNGILHLDAWDGDTTFAGYILGGIKSSQANIFFINTGVESEAHNKLYKVSLMRKPASSTSPLAITADFPFQISPNPFKDQISVAFEVSAQRALGIQVSDFNGRKILKVPEQLFQPGKHEISLSLRWFPMGNYTVSLLEKGRIIAASQVIKQ